MTTLLEILLFLGFVIGVVVYSDRMDRVKLKAVDSPPSNDPQESKPRRMHARNTHVRIDTLFGMFDIKTDVLVEHNTISVELQPNSFELEIVEALRQHMHGGPAVFNTPLNTSECNVDVLCINFIDNGVAKTLSADCALFKCIMPMTVDKPTYTVLFECYPLYVDRDKE